MKTASTFLHFLALSACLAAQFCEPGEFRMPGMRRALQTVSAAQQPVGSIPEVAIDLGG
jgi:hypothetical protein